MAAFAVAGQVIYIPAIRAALKPTSQPSAWLNGDWITVQTTEDIQGIRVHTNGRDLPATATNAFRPASGAQGAWVAIGDVILTSGEMVDQSALPGAFTHVAEAVIPSGCVINIGFNGPVLAGSGGGTQAEYVSGPPFKFTQLRAKWMPRAGSA